MRLAFFGERSRQIAADLAVPDQAAERARPARPRELFTLQGDESGPFPTRQRIARLNAEDLIDDRVARRDGSAHDRVDARELEQRERSRERGLGGELSLARGEHGPAEPRVDGGVPRGRGRDQVRKLPPDWRASDRAPPRAAGSGSSAPRCRRRCPRRDRPRPSSPASQQRAIRCERRRGRAAVEPPRAFGVELGQRVARDLSASGEEHGRPSGDGRQPVVSVRPLENQHRAHAPEAERARERAPERGRESSFLHVAEIRRFGLHQARRRRHEASAEREERDHRLYRGSCPERVPELTLRGRDGDARHSITEHTTESLGFPSRRSGACRCRERSRSRRLEPTARRFEGRVERARPRARREGSGCVM